MRDVKLAYASDHGALRDYFVVATVIALVTLVAWFAPVSYNAAGYIYLLAVIALSMGISRWPALAAAVLSGLAWDFFCVPPKLSLAGIHFDEGLLLTTYFAVALIGSQLTALRSTADRAGLLAQSERMHQTLLDSLSHELMTPVSVLRSAIEQLDTQDQAKRDRVIVELSIATARLDSLVGNLLNQNRLESGVLKPMVDWCEIHELVGSARKAVGGRIGDHPLTIDLPDELPIFKADAVLMEQTIAQLLINAAVHTPPVTEIKVGAGTTPDSKKVFISIEDNGPGVPSEIQGTLFEKFTRGPNAKKGGLGLGLSIVRGFMESQGGEVAYETPKGGGSRFVLLFPFEKPDGIPI